MHTVRGLLFSSPAIGKRRKGTRGQSILGRDGDDQKATTPSLDASFLAALSPSLPDPVFCPDPLLSRTGCLIHQGRFSGVDTPQKLLEGRSHAFHGAQGSWGGAVLTLSSRLRALSCNTGCRVGLRGRLCSSGSGTGSSRQDT